MSEQTGAPTHAESDRLRCWVLSNQALSAEQRVALMDVLGDLGSLLRVVSLVGELPAGCAALLGSLGPLYARLLEVAG